VCEVELALLEDIVQNQEISSEMYDLFIEQVSMNICVLIKGKQSKCSECSSRLVRKSVIIN